MSRWRVLAAAGVVAGVSTWVVYFLVITGEDNNSGREIALWSCLMLAPCAMAVIATIAPARVAGGLLAVACGALTVVAVLAVFSVGIGFFLAAMLMLSSYLDRPRPAPVVASRHS